MLLASLALAGCGASGPEVRTTSDPAEWAPTRIVVLPPTGGSSVIPPGTTFPEGVTATTLPEAVAATASALSDAIRTSTTLIEVAPWVPFTITAAGLPAPARASSTALAQALAAASTLAQDPLAGASPGSSSAAASSQPAVSKTDIAGLIEEVSRQYLDARQIDPATAKALGAALGTDAYLLTAMLRYGPEVDGDAQQVSKGVGTSVKTTDLGINFASSYIIVYYNAQLRSALVRSADGMIVWDAASRQRERRGALRTVTQASVLKTAVETLMVGFPWKAVEPDHPDH